MDPHQLEHSSGVADVCYSLDGSSLAACCVDGQMQVRLGPGG
jgi:hypothetical protein